MGQLRHEPVVREVDRALGAEHVQLQAHPADQPGERHHERRDPDLGHDHAVQYADQGTCQHHGGDPDHVGDADAYGQRGEHRPGQTGDRADRQVDLTEQQHQYDAHRDRSGGGDLERQVVEVLRCEEGAVQALEHDPDHDQPHHHRQRSQLAAAQPPAQPAYPQRLPDRLDRGAGRDCQHRLGGALHDAHRTPSLREGGASHVHGVNDSLASSLTFPPPMHWYEPFAGSRRSPRRR